VEVLAHERDAPADLEQRVSVLEGEVAELRRAVRSLEDLRTE
jgi:NTP pyrophosphatase (non-canonical NTP hydrolase)